MSVAILLLALAAFSVSWYTLHSTRSKIVAKRLGQDPGILNFKQAASKRYFVSNGHSLVREGYKQSKDEKYVVQTQDMERLILPPKYLSELRMSPETKLSHSVALVERHLGYYSGVDIILQDKQHSDIC
ncbi:hypothetical protein HYALB_00011970 [Hymenoscyphus albidus]|uniref:Uncharacterized protein n=1 Tax=Hymenoscyphus albidus TaxID=595503 RepID=A0A9N9LMQ0_9HELO|nr:hypothetical protein HYALB_00011970 [Hymenoscyphus albidus]